MNQQPYRKNNKNAEAEKVCRKAAQYSSNAPAWPSEQPVIVMPPGSDPISLGMPDAVVYPQSEPYQSPAPDIPKTDHPTNDITNTNKQPELNTFLLRHLGKCVRLSFSPEAERADQLGILLEIGNSYLVLQEFASQNLFVCNLSYLQSIHIYNEFLPDTSRSLFGI